MIPSPHILIITYYWPPSGGPAVQRWLDYTRLLAEKNYKISILTVDENYAQFPSLDYSLTERIHPSIKIYKTRTREIFSLYKKTIGRGNVPSSAFANESNPGPLKKISRFIRGNFFLPDPRKPWNTYLIPVASEIIENEKPDLIITAGPPHSTHLAGMFLKNKFHIPWIADFHDAWTDIIFYKALYHTAPARWYDAKLERTVLTHADLILCVGEKYNDKLNSKLAKKNPEKFHILRMGYDAELFPVTLPKEINTVKPVKIIYTGTIADNYDPAVLFKALDSVQKDNPDLQFELVFAGTLSENIRKQIRTVSPSVRLTEPGYLSHEKVIELLHQADFLLLVNPHIEQEEMVIPGKIYEYLAAERNIINITTQQAETARIIKSCDTGETFERNQEAELKKYILDVIQGNVKHQFNKNCIYKYSRQSQADNLDQQIRKVLTHV